MPQSSPTETPLSAVLRERGAGLGASVTALARELETRLDPVHRAALVELIRNWPREQDADALYHRLLEMRALPAALPASGRAGSAAKGLVLGAGAGAPLGFLAFVALAEFIMPRAFSSVPVMAGFVAGAVGLGGFIGFRHGAAPSRGGRMVARGILGFLCGALLGAFAGVFVAGILGWLLDVSQMEGAFAMGVVFVIAPLSGLAGGSLLGLWMARKAWRDWGRSA